MATDIATLGIRIDSDGVPKASDRLKTLTAEGGKAESSNNKLSSSFDGIAKYATIAAAAMVGMKLVSYAKEAMGVALEMEKLNRQFTVFTGSANLAAREMQFVKNEANRLGLDMRSLTASYALYMNAVKGTINEGQRGRDAFIGISEGMAAVGMAADKQGAAWAQLNQGIMKGKFELEDLKTINEAGLPIFKLMADALGVTTSQFMRMQSEGKVLANDVLPLLGKSMHDAYGVAAMEGAMAAQGQINKMNNAMLESKAIVGASLMPVFTSLLENVFVPLASVIGNIVKGLQKIAALAAHVTFDVGTGLKGFFTGKDVTSEHAENLSIYEAQMLKISGSPTSTDYTAAEMMRQKSIKADPYQSGTTAKQKAAEQKKAADVAIKALKDQQDAFYNLGQEIEQTADSASRVFGIMTTGGGDLKTDRYNVTSLSSYSLLSNVSHSNAQSDITGAYDAEQAAKVRSMMYSMNSGINNSNGNDFASEADRIEEQRKMRDDAIKAEITADADKKALLLKSEEEYIAAKKRLDSEKWGAAVGIVGDNLSTIGAMLMQGNKEQFEAGKKFAIASAMLNTYMAASNAFVAGSKLNVYFGIASAAVAVAAGMAQMAQIQSQQYEARELGGPVTAGQPYIVGEKRAEVFVPNQSGRIIPSTGEKSTNVTVVNQISAGVIDTTRAEIGRYIPLIVAQSVQAVKSAMSQGEFQRA